jgi:hypothetical protein
VDPDYPFVLRERLGHAGVAALSDLFASQKADIMTLVVDTFERRLGDECARLRSDVRSEMKELRSELGSAFKVEVANVRADLLKWSFLFWLGQVAAVYGLVAVLR